MTVSTNLVTAVVFLPFWFLGGNILPWYDWWQPALVGILYMVGQICTFLAVERGDVSVAAPLLSVKVVLVAIFLTLLDGAQLPWSIWLAAFIATIGIATVQRSQSRGGHGRVVFTIVFCASGGGDVCAVRRGRPALGSNMGPWPIVAARVPYRRINLRRALAMVRSFSARTRLGASPGDGGLHSVRATVSRDRHLDWRFRRCGAREYRLFAPRHLGRVALVDAGSKARKQRAREHSRSIMISRLCGAGLLTVAVFLAIFSRMD